jgi:inward rectifier potassium channel
VTAIPPGARKVRQQGSTFYVLGEERAWLRDVYHLFLRLPWLGTFGVIAAAFLLADVAFAGIYMLTGGVANSSGSFFDSFAFSVETMATIGYGQMFPAGHGATYVMVAESVCGLILTALATGIVFAKFSRPNTRVAFSKHVVFTQHDGKRTMIFRVGNRRNNVIIEAQLHVVCVMTTMTQEGNVFYKAYDLKLARDRQVGMTRGWTVLHVVDENSPLYGLDNVEALKKYEVEVYVSLAGVDDVTMQQVNTVFQYTDMDCFKPDHHFADQVIPLDGGAFLTDITQFDVVIPDTVPAP